jgi:hypothetical protein
MQSFYFEQLLQSGLNGIDQQGITAVITQIASVILMATFLWSIYEAYSNGGDIRLIGISALKYLILGLVFLHYQSAFRSVNSMFNGVADELYNLSGGLDIINMWENSLANAWNNSPSWASALWSWTTGGISATVAGLIILMGYVLLPLTYTLFALFYSLYGAVLYVIGPIVLALLPSRGLGQMGRSFVTNMMIFQCWGVLYAILQSLMSALQITSPMQIGGSFLQSFVGSSQVILMSLASTLLAIMIGLIPLIATRVVRGDIGSIVVSIISGAVTAASTASGMAFSASDRIVGSAVLAQDGPLRPGSAIMGYSPRPTMQGSVLSNAVGKS